MKWNFPNTEVDGYEHPKGKSQTIPNQALQIREIMFRSLRGQILPEVTGNNLEYGDDEDFEDAFSPEQDLTDIEANQSQIDYLSQRVEQAKQAKAKPKHQDSEKSDGEELPPPNAEKVD